MQFLLLSVMFSVSVSVLLKLVPRYQLDIRQAIAVNYAVAASLAAWFLVPNPKALLNESAEVWAVLLLLGVMLPAMFGVLAAAVKKTGMIKTDAAMRLSLLIPLVAAFTWFGETPSLLKLIALVLGLLAVMLIVIKPGRSTFKQTHWPLLLLVFVGMGAIDILFKLVAKQSHVSFSSTLFMVFVLAALLSFVAIFWLYARHKARFALRHWIAGLLLGALNFGNIFYYVTAHRALPNQPSVVFAGMNIGIIVLATFVGFIVFRESLSATNKTGLLVAIASITLLSFA